MSCYHEDTAIGSAKALLGSPAETVHPSKDGAGALSASASGGGAGGGSLPNSAEYGGVHSYETLSKSLAGLRRLAGHNIDVHHLIEQRFCDALGLDPDEMPAVVLRRNGNAQAIGYQDLPHHQEITNRLNAAIGRGTNYDSIDPSVIRDAHVSVYRDLAQVYPSAAPIFERWVNYVESEFQEVFRSLHL